MHAVLCALCWITVISCTLCFCTITAVRPTQWFSDDEAFRSLRDGTAIPGPKGKNQADSDHTISLWDGNQGFVVALQWGSVMLAGIATAALKLIKTRQTNRIHDGAGNSQDTAALVRLARRIVFTQLPPTALWQHLCGGLTVLDASLVLMWIGFTVLYLHQCTEAHFIQVAGEVGMSSAEWALARIDAVADASGTVLLFLMMIMFFPVSRSSFLKTVFSSSFQALIKYHRWMAWGTIWIALGHSCLFFVLWGAEGTLADNLNFTSEAAAKNVMGTISMILFLVVAGTANSWFRSKYHKIFYPIHVASFLVIAAFGIFHSPMMAYWLLPALVVYAMDRAFRYWQLAANWTRLTPADVAVDGSIITLCLRWNRTPKAVSPGQTVYLRVPALSLFYTHPFSVADVSEEGNVSRVLLHIRMVGTWTKGLMDRLSNGETLGCQVEGPYESKLDYLSAAPAIVLVAGGTGVTPVLALLRHFARMAHSGARVPQVHFLWTSRSLCELRLLGSDLLAAANHSTDRALPTKISESGCSQVSSDSGGQWLHATLHYTGFEQEQKKTAVTVELPSITSMEAVHGSPRDIRIDPESLIASKNGGQADLQLLLRAHPGANPYIYAVSIFLTFTCAWGGFMLGNLFIQHNMNEHGSGYNYMLCGFIQFISIVICAIVPPFLLQAVLHAAYRKTGLVNSDVLHFQEGASKDDFKPSIQVLPGYVLAPTDTSALDLGTVQLERGRPKFAALLDSVRQRYAHLQQVDVVVAGPDGLCRSVQELCQQHKPGGPELLCRRAAYHT